MISDKQSLKSYVSYQSQKSQKTMGSYGNKKKQQLQKQQEVNEQQLVEQFSENEARMKKIRMEAKKRKKLKEQEAQEQIQREQEMARLKKEQKKQENLKKFNTKQRVDPKKHTGNIKGLDLDTKGSKLIFDKMNKQTDERDDEMFVQNNRLLDSLDLSGSNIFLQKQLSQRENKIIQQENKPKQDKAILQQQYIQQKLNQNQPKEIQKQQKEIQDFPRQSEEEFPKKQQITRQQLKQEQHQPKIQQIQEDRKPVYQNQQQQHQQQFQHKPIQEEKMQNQIKKFENYKQNVDPDFDEIEELIGYSSDGESKKQEETMSQVQHRQTPIVQQQSQKLQKELPQRKIVSKPNSQHKNPQNSVLSNATRYNFNENEFLRADLININREEQEVQKDLYDIQFNNQCQLRDVYDRNEIRQKYQDSNDVIKQLQMSIVPNQKNGNYEHDLEASLANLDNVLEKQKIKQYRQQVQMDALKNQQEKKLQQDEELRDEIIRQQQEIIEQQRKLLEQRKNEKIEKILETQSIKSQKSQVTVNNPILQDLSQITEIKHTNWQKNPVLSDQKLQKTVKALDSQLAKISKQTSIHEDNDKKTNQNIQKNSRQQIKQQQSQKNSQDTTFNREETPQICSINFFDDVDEMNMNYSQISRYSQQKQSEVTQDKSLNTTEVTKLNDKSGYSKMSGQQNTNYGQQYKKTKEEKIHQIQKKIPKPRQPQAEIVEIKRDDHNLKVNNKLKNLLFDVQEDSLEM